MVRKSKTVSGTVEVVSFTSAEVGQPVTAVDLEILSGKDHIVPCSTTISEGVSNLSTIIAGGVSNATGSPNILLYTIETVIKFHKPFDSVPRVLTGIESSSSVGFVNAPIISLLNSATISVDNVTPCQFTLRAIVSLSGENIASNREFFKALLIPPTGGNHIRLNYLANVSR